MFDGASYAQARFSDVIRRRSTSARSTSSCPDYEKRQLHMQRVASCLLNCLRGLLLFRIIRPMATLANKADDTYFDNQAPFMDSNPLYSYTRPRIPSSRKDIHLAARHHVDCHALPRRMFAKHTRTALDCSRWCTERSTPAAWRK